MTFNDLQALKTRINNNDHDLDELDRSSKSFQRHVPTFSQNVYNTE